MNVCPLKLYNTLPSRNCSPQRVLKTFAVEPLHVIGMVRTPTEGNAWRVEETELVVLSNGLKRLIDRDHLKALGIAVQHTLIFSKGQNHKHNANLNFA